MPSCGQPLQGAEREQVVGRETAVNGASPASSASMPSAPPSRLNPVLTTSRSSNAIPASARPRR